METTRNLESDIRSERAIFQRASELLQPGPFFRLSTYLYAERKLYVFFFVHLMCTIVVWCKYKVNQPCPEERTNEWSTTHDFLLLGNSSFCFDQIQRAGWKSVRRRQSLLAQKDCTFTWIRINARYLAPNGSYSANNVPFCYSRTLWVNPFLASGPIPSNAHTSRLYHGYNCLSGDCIFLYFFRHIMQWWWTSLLR